MRMNDLRQQIRTDLFKQDEDYRRLAEEAYERSEIETGEDDETDEDASDDWNDDWHNDPRHE